MLALVTLFFAAAGAIYQRVEMWRDARRFPQRGKSFQVGRIKLNLNCSGQGSPTVILESGLGGSALDWIRVQPTVASFAHVCSYDRAGYGWSDASTAPRTSHQIAVELRSLLNVARGKGPYVLVGHSLGGYNIRVFTGLFPGDVAGMVLVDASHPDEEARIQHLLPPTVAAEEKREDERRQRWDWILDPLRLHLGIERLQLATGWKKSPHFSKEVQREFLFLEQQAKSVSVVKSEDLLSAESGSQAAAAGNLGDLPLIVLTAGNPYGPDPLLTNDQMKQQDGMWIKVLQVQEAHLSTRGKQIVVSESTHDMPSEQPDVIAAAIHEVWIAAGQR